MFRTFAIVVASIQLLACGDADPRDSNESPKPDAARGPDLSDMAQQPPTQQSNDTEPEPIGEPQSNPGGTSGSEGSLSPCEDTATALATLDTVSEAVGVSGADLLALANRQPEVALRWPPLDSGPKLDDDAPILQLRIAAGSQPATEFVCTDPKFPEKYRPKPRVELPVVVTLRTANGALDVHYDAVLTTDAAGTAATGQVTLEPEAVGGSVGRAVATFYTAGYRTMVFELNFGPNGPSGAMLGPFSAHKTRPCAYTAYAYWPEESSCWPERAGEPIDDTDSLRPHLERANRTTFDLTWSDGHNERTEAKLEVQLADGATCDANEQLSHPVQVRLTTADGRADLMLPALLSGGPSSIDPWPAKLSHVEPFYFDLSGTIALDAAALKTQLEISDPSVSAAIVNFYVSSPSGIDSPVLSGGLRVTPIDRTGFDSPLPTVDLPGGDSEDCFSAAPRTAILSAALVAP